MTKSVAWMAAFMELGRLGIRLWGPMGIRMEGEGWGSENVVMDREFGPTTQEVYSAIENAVKELYILIWPVFCEGFFCRQYSMWNSKLYFSFLKCLTRKCIYNHNCDRQQEWVCAQVPWKSAEEDSHRGLGDNVQLPSSLAAGHRSHRHMVSCGRGYVWLSGLQKLIR